MMLGLGGRRGGRLGGEVSLDRIVDCMFWELIDEDRYCWDVFGLEDIWGSGCGRVSSSLITIVKIEAHVTLRASLKDVARVARLTADNIVSVGASLSHVHVPGRAADDSSEDAVKGGEIEVGMGIHNEPGSERVKTDLIGLVKKMLAQLLDQSDKDMSFLEISKTDKIVLLINNLGGVSVLEIGGIIAEVSKQLSENYDIKPVRLLAGAFMTSLNGMGFSISLLKLVDT